jgi:hypothetical protein
MTAVEKADLSNPEPGAGVIIAIYCDQMRNKACDITWGTRQIVNPSENVKQRYSAHNMNIQEGT